MKLCGKGSEAPPAPPPLLERPLSEVRDAGMLPQLIGAQDFSGKEPH